MKRQRIKITLISLILITSQSVHASLLSYAASRIIVALGFLPYEIAQAKKKWLPSVQDYEKLTTGYHIPSTDMSRFIALRILGSDGRDMKEKTLARYLYNNPQPIIETLSTSYSKDARTEKTFYGCYAVHAKELMFSGPIKPQEQTQLLAAAAKSSIDEKQLPTNKHLLLFIKRDSDSKTFTTVNQATWSNSWGTYTAKIENDSQQGSTIKVQLEPSESMRKLHEKRLKAESKSAPIDESILITEYTQYRETI